ncbi:MAG: TssQ family T6SS-associated lipoprotein [Burkholderiales bacterium]|nr:TssQ family T6SS-associated lipoprotein [Burkholderiales bacterium]
MSTQPFRRRALAAASLALLLAGGCSSTPVRTVGADQIAPRRAERELSAGIRAYEEGKYAVATARLQSALAAELLFTSDKVAAHKYLAFVHCAAGRTQQCRAEFRQAFALDPGFELSHAEAGHPLWGPVYLSVREESRRGQRK